MGVEMGARRGEDYTSNPSCIPYLSASQDRLHIIRSYTFPIHSFSRGRFSLNSMGVACHLKGFHWDPNGKGRIPTLNANIATTEDTDSPTKSIHASSPTLASSC